jgi:hypothetical protein
MISLAAFDVVDGIQRHRFVGTFKDGRFIHFIPEATDAGLHEVRVEGAPPLAHRCAGEIGEDAVSGPDFSNVLGTVGILHEVVSFDPFVILLVTWQLCQVEIGDGHDLETFNLQVAHHFLEVGEELRSTVNGRMFCW